MEELPPLTPPYTGGGHAALGDGDVLGNHPSPLHGGRIRYVGEWWCAWQSSLPLCKGEPEGVVGKLKSKIKKRVVGKYQTIHYIYNIKK